jgi:hypothetical protein
MMRVAVNKTAIIRILINHFRPFALISRNALIAQKIEKNNSKYNVGTKRKFFPLNKIL